jgi:hypothetical protein
MATSFILLVKEVVDEIPKGKTKEYMEVLYRLD